jgi:hypothetical protein
MEGYYDIRTTVGNSLSRFYTCSPLAADSLVVYHFKTECIRINN